MKGDMTVLEVLIGIASRMNAAKEYAIIMEQQSGVKIAALVQKSLLLARRKKQPPRFLSITTFLTPPNTAKSWKHSTTLWQEWRTPSIFASWLICQSCHAATCRRSRDGRRMKAEARDISKRPLWHHKGHAEASSKRYRSETDSL